MHPLMLFNDEIRPTSDEVFRAGQTGVLTGWGVFSTIRIYDGVLFAWERHLARMQHDAERMRVPFPADPQRLEAGIYRLIEANQISGGTLRLCILRNHGGLFEGPGPDRPSEVIGFTRQVNNWGDRVKLGVAPNARHAANEFAGVKCLSWAQNLTWYERAREQGFDEMLLLNERGEVAECTSANIFAVYGSQVRTPPLSDGCLPGVTRAVLLNELELNGLEVVEKTLLPASLADADEVMITSTTRELLPVESIQGVKIRFASQVCSQLVAALKSYVAQYVAARRPVRS